MENKKAPDFCVKSDEGVDVELKNFLGQWVVLYFYPKDDTPGCTLEAKEFTENIAEFEKLNCRVLGVSKDAVQKHCKFIDKYSLKINLLSDEEGEICEKYGVIVEKNMYGRKYMGIERSTFLINPEGIVSKIWRKVKVKGHVQDVLTNLKEGLS